MIFQTQDDPQSSVLPPLPSYLLNPPQSSSPPPHPSLPPPHPSIPPPAYTPQSTSHSEGVTILLKCPRLSSCSWILRLYATVCGGIGVIFSILWLVGHCYVLGQTDDHGLRIQRLG